MKNLPRLTRPRVDGSLPPALIDAVVTQSIHGHQSLYDLDVQLLEDLKPDVILTQELCEVCAVSYDQVLGAARLLEQHGDAPAIVSLEPKTLDEVIETGPIVADTLGESARGQTLRQRLRKDLDGLREMGRQRASHPTVLVLEWPEPPWIGGHWVPDMVSVAGGRNPPQQMARRGAPSIRVTWAEVAANKPDLIVVAPCGYDLRQAATAIVDLNHEPEWQTLDAVQYGRVYPVDANKSWSRPGPGLLDGIAELQRLL